MKLYIKPLNPVIDSSTHQVLYPISISLKRKKNSVLVNNSISPHARNKKVSYKPNNSIENLLENSVIWRVFNNEEGNSLLLMNKSFRRPCIYLNKKGLINFLKEWT